MPVFTDRLKQLRAEKHITQKQLADFLNVTQNAVFNWENGKRKPSIEMIEKIAVFFNVSPSYLMGWYTEPESVSPEHPIAFPGLEKKLTEIGYGIFYGCDFVEYSDDEIWIEYPDGKKVFLTLSELENLNLETDTYLKFRIDQLGEKKS